MTRDEAIEKWESEVLRFRHAVDGFAALGMIKFDEPKSEIAPVKAQNMLHYRFGYKEGERLLQDMDAAGLKIVEK